MPTIDTVDVACDPVPMRGVLDRHLHCTAVVPRRYRFIELASDRAGTAAVEFALVAPALVMIMLATFQFGITLNNYQMVTGAAMTATRQFALSRGSSTPRTDAVNQVYNSAPNLIRANLTITTSVNGANCTSDATCQTALTAGQGLPASVRSSYPCNLIIYGHNYFPSCTLTSTTTERIE